MLCCYQLDISLEFSGLFPVIPNIIATTYFSVYYIIFMGSHWKALALKWSRRPTCLPWLSHVSRSPTHFTHTFLESKTSQNMNQMWHPVIPRRIGLKSSEKCRRYFYRSQMAVEAAALYHWHGRQKCSQSPNFPLFYLWYVFSIFPIDLFLTDAISHIGFNMLLKSWCYWCIKTGNWTYFLFGSFLRPSSL